MNFTMMRSHGPATVGKACPACSSMACETLYSISHNSDESFIYLCKSCSLKFLHPLILSERNDRQMDSIVDAELFSSKLLQKLHKCLIVGREIKKVQTLLGRRYFSLLDIGCGTGLIAAMWAEQGAEVTGLEPSANRSRFAREQRGLRVLDTFVEDLDQGETFDVVTIRHVLEHLENPRSTLDNIRSHLRTDGLLVVIVPNIDCLGRYLFGTRWSWILPWHCLFFNPRSLRRIVEQAGFHVEKLYQTPSPLWYPESFLRLFPDQSGFVRKVYGKLSLIPLLPFAPLVAAGYLTGMSDNLTLIARVAKK